VRQDILPTSLAALHPLLDAYRELEASVPVARRAPAVLDDGGGDQRLLIRGNHQNLGPPVPRRYLEALRSKPYSGPARLQLADAVASASNPLMLGIERSRKMRSRY